MNIKHVFFKLLDQLVWILPLSAAEVGWKSEEDFIIHIGGKK